MKFSVFSFVIAFILEDYGTFQGRPIDKTTPIERAEIFRKYALELVNAAIPPLRENREIMELGCECIPIIEEDEMVVSIDLFLAVLAIGKDYYSDLHVLRLAEDVPEVVDRKPGLMKNVEKIIAVFQSPSRRFRHATVDEVLRLYVLKHKDDPSAAGTSRYDESLKLAITCFKSMISLYHTDNSTYYNKLKKGFEIIGGLLREYDDDDEDLDGDSRWGELDTIVEEIPKLHLTTSNSEYMEQEIEKFLEKLNENNQEDSDAD